MAENDKRSGRRAASIQSLMGTGNPSFGRMLAHAKALERLDRKVASYLEPGLVPHCQVADFRGRRLVLVCSSASYAARLRMLSQALLDAIRSDIGLDIETIEVRVAPVSRPQPTTRERKALPAAAMEALRRFASDSEDDEIRALFEEIRKRQEDD